LNDAGLATYHRRSQGGKGAMPSPNF